MFSKCVIFIAGKNNFCSALFGGFTDTGSDKTAPGVIARDIGYNNFLGTGFKSLLHHLTD